MNRRHFFKLLFALTAAGIFRPNLGFAANYVTGHSDVSNFRRIYGDAALRAQFFLFLKNVYSIYPPEKFHALITDVTSANDTDIAIYAALQKKLPDIKSFLSPLMYQLPALSHQKKEMSGQLARILKGTKEIDGYMEIGTTGRYVTGVKEATHVKGDIYLLHTQRPQSFSVIDIAERGQLQQAGKFIDMGNYKNIADEDVPDSSLDLITNFIGFHHAPPDIRNDFIASVVSKLRPGGCLILRDHNVDSDDIGYIVALAHDVFNAGLDVPWEIDLHEIRNFTSVAQIDEVLAKAGLHRQGDGLLQPGDPTQNTLMRFVKA